MNKLKVLVWNEFIHEKTMPEVAKVYPKGIHTVIAEFLSPEKDFEVKTATMDMPSHGLTDEVLASTDVLVWWSHLAWPDFSDEIVEKVYQRILNGMGFVVLHSGCISKVFKKITGTRCRMRWREAGEKERIWVTDPGHQIAAGLPAYFEIPHEETYGEHWQIPAPDELVFISWFEGGEVFRSGLCYRRERGRIFFFRPGHETYPVYYMPEVQLVIKNAIRWAAPTGGPEPSVGEHTEPLEKTGK